MPSVLEEETLSVAAAAELLQVSTSTLWRWIDRGDLPAYRIGRRRVRIKKSDVEDRLVSARAPRLTQGQPIDTSLADIPRRLTPEERAPALDALERVKELRHERTRQLS